MQFPAQSERGLGRTGLNDVPGDQVPRPPAVPNRSQAAAQKHVWSVFAERRMARRAGDRTAAVRPTEIPDGMDRVAGRRSGGSLEESRDETGHVLSRATPVPFWCGASTRADAST